MWKQAARRSIRVSSDVRQSRGANSGASDRRCASGGPLELYSHYTLEFPAKLRGIRGRIQVTPDEPGQFVWADYELGVTALGPNADLVVAGLDSELEVSEKKRKIWLQ